MAGAEPAVVVTTLNPFSALPAQLRAFEAWAALGLRPVTVNVAAEAERLRAAGISAGAILEIAAADTGLALYGRPMPRIVPVLARVEALFPDRPILLVNGDIHPAARSSEVVRLWLAQAPALALTRQDCTLLEAARATDGGPYRNGLDAFLFAPWALAAVNRRLADLPATERMAFGIPGWDFLLGALVRSPAVGGRIMDGAVLLHEWHAPTYETINNFAPLVPAMIAAGAPGGASAAEAAEAFHQVIVRDCAAAENLARRVRLLYGDAQAAPEPHEAARRLAMTFVDLLPFVRWTYDFGALVALAVRAGGTGEASWARLLRFFRTPGAVAHGFAETLLATDFILCARGGTVLPSSHSRTPADQLKPLLAPSLRDPLLARIRLAEVFGEEVVAAGRFSPRLFAALALSCHNDAERLLAGRIRQHAGGVA